jgi:heme-degrading monooxygenase HmoA
MVEIVSEFVIKEGARGQFELAYGPGGAWSNLFARSPGFRGTTVLRDMRNPRRYLTFELWETEAEREQARVERKTEQSVLDASFRDWVESTTEMGVFGMLAEATVHPRGRLGRNTAGGARRRSRPSTR